MAVVWDVENCYLPESLGLPHSRVCSAIQLALSDLGGELIEPVTIAVRHKHFRTMYSADVRKDLQSHGHLIDLRVTDIDGVVRQRPLRCSSP